MKMVCELQQCAYTCKLFNSLQLVLLTSLFIAKCENCRGAMFGLLQNTS